MIKVLDSGFYSTIQDLGRMDYQAYGVPYSGVMDVYSAKLANALLNNEMDAAVMEITMTGPKLLFNTVTSICITGADLSPKLNDKTVKQNYLIPVKDGDVLTFGKLNYGFRAYIAVLGGFQTENVMQSRSMYQGITKSFRLNKEDTMSITTPVFPICDTHAGLKVNTAHFISTIIEVYKGPEFDALSAVQQTQLFKQHFTVSKDNSRMAYQLNEAFNNNLKAIITSLVMPGTVQLTPSGKLIILMKDCQSTGGYPRILQLKDTSIGILSQKFIGSKFQFVLNDL